MNEDVTTVTLTVTVQLSKREIKIAQYLSNGCRVKEISEMLKENDEIILSHRTIETMIYRLMERLHVTSRMEMIKLLIKNNIIF